MRTLAILAAGILCGAMLPATVTLADVGIDARIRTAMPIGGGPGGGPGWGGPGGGGVDRIEIHASNSKVGVCGLTGTVEVFRRDRLACVYNIARSSVLEANSSPIGLHDNGMSTDCLGANNTANPLVVVNLVADPGVTLTFTPGNGQGGRDCRFPMNASYTFCTKDNTSSACVPVRSFHLNIDAH